MAFIRRVRTASGATAVQLAEYRAGRQRIVKHVGSAHTDAELGLLLVRARELLVAAGQGVFDLGVEPTPRKTSRVAAPVAAGLLSVSATEQDRPFTPSGRVVGTASRLLFDVLAQVYASLGFDDVVSDEVFRDLVIARIVEPTSILDTGRVLSELGQRPASDKTLRRTLARAQQRVTVTRSRPRVSPTPPRPGTSPCACTT